MKSTLEGIISRLCDLEKCMPDLDDRIMEIIQLEQWKEKQIKKIRTVTDSLEQHHIYQYLHL